MITKHFYLPEQMVKKLEALKQKTGLSVAEIVRRALDEYMKKQK